MNSLIALKNLFQERFFAKIVNFTSHSFDTKLNEIRQKSNEFIISYYKRFLTLMLRIEVKNRLSIETLFLLKSTILDVIMKTFVRELLNDDVRKKIIKDFVMIEKSFCELCTMTKNAN